MWKIAFVKYFKEISSLRKLFLYFFVCVIVAESINEIMEKFIACFCSFDLILIFFIEGKKFL